MDSFITLCIAGQRLSGRTPGAPASVSESSQHLVTVNEEPRKNKTQHKQEAAWGGPAGRPHSVLRADTCPPRAGSRRGGTICTSSEKRPLNSSVYGRFLGARLVRKPHQLLQPHPMTRSHGHLGPSPVQGLCSGSPQCPEHSSLSSSVPVSYRCETNDLKLSN